MKTRNEVFFTGGIVAIHKSKTLPLMTIATTVTSAASTAFPTITFYDPKMVDDYTIGDRVSIKARVRLRISRDSNGKTLSYNQDYVADSITKADRILAPFITDFAISKKDGGVKPDENRAYIFGTVYHKFEAKNRVVILGIAVPREDGHIDRCEITCFSRQADTGRMLNEGDCVMTAGAVQTRKEKDSNGRTYTLQNIVCKDILKCEKFENLN